MGSLISQNIPYSGVTLSQQSIPVGMIIPTSGTTVPSGYLKCDGTVYSISLYPHLAAFYESEFGYCNRYGGNGTTTFAVPDLCGEFIRGAGTNSHISGLGSGIREGDGAAVGEHQGGTVDVFTFGSDGNAILSAEYNASLTYNHDRELTSQSRKQASGASTTSYGTFYTSRPTNTSFIYLVKAKPDRLDKITFAEVDDTSAADDVVWSGEKVREAIGPESYSTSEQWTGKYWIDGKKIYQKTINIAPLPNNTTKNVQLGDPTIIKDVISISGFANRPDGDNLAITLPRPYPVNNSNNPSIDIIYTGMQSSHPGVLLIITMMDYSGFTQAYVTVQYTKTTD